MQAHTNAGCALLHLCLYILFIISEIFDQEIAVAPVLLYLNLVGILFADNGCLNIRNFSSGPGLHAFNGDGNSVGNLLIQTAQRFFPDKLRGNLAHRLIRYRILIVKIGAIGQVFENLYCHL